MIPSKGEKTPHMHVQLASTHPTKSSSASGAPMLLGGILVVKGVGRVTVDHWFISVFCRVVTYQTHLLQRDACDILLTQVHGKKKLSFEIHC